LCTPLHESALPSVTGNRAADACFLLFRLDVVDRFMDMSAILENLNEAQREAVTLAPGAALVLAGAGSGKTRVLVHRIAWLISQKGFSPHSIMAVTFTNKAAAEMRERLESLLNVSAGSMWTGTFHGLSHRLLRMHWKEASLPEQFHIIDSDDQLRLIKRIIGSMELDEAKWPPRQAQAFINGKKDEGIRPEHDIPAAGPYGQIMHRIYTTYEQLCRQQGLVDFAELLLRSNELLRDNAELQARYRQRFRYLLVDEFQDTNAVQYAWLKNLVGTQGHLMAVGDDDQSIYGWRGAKIENIHRFSSEFNEVTTIRLEQNYRSTARILQAANALINHNPDRLGKSLWTSGEQGSPISLYSGFNEVDEARFVADLVQKRGSQGGAFRDVAVLYRSNAQSRVLEEAMLRSGIPYRIHGGQRFFDRAEIRNAMAWLRLTNNANDDTALERVINIPPRGLGDKTVQGIRDIARTAELSMWQAIKKMLADNIPGPRVGKALSSFVSQVESLVVHREAPLADLADLCIQSSGLRDYYQKEPGEKSLSRLENLNELVSACRDFEPAALSAEDQAPSASPLEAFLTHAALEAGEAASGPEVDSIQMMTLHAAKGLEFPIVFMAGMEDGLFPHQMSMEDNDRLQEERRLCYVGITRAREQLYMTHAENRRIHGRDVRMKPSRFLQEIPRELLEDVRIRSSVRRPVTAGSRGLASLPVPGTGLHLGQRVRHPHFGEGVILNSEGRDSRARVQIRFDREGVKWLMVAYAHLETDLLRES